MNVNTQRFSLYGFCMLVSASLVAFLAMSMDHFVGYINQILIPCQHDSVWENGRCICDNTKGIFSGEYCESCQCEHLGLCRMSAEGAVDTRWSCRCPSHQKWVGTTCNKCYASHNTSDQCKGPCIANHYGENCNTHCVPDRPTATDSQVCSEVRASGGKCNICNGHGTCTGDGLCQCDEGYFTSRTGEQCSLSCESCPSERGVCTSVGGQLQCICKGNYFGPNCEQSCQSSNELVCSGHGVCQFSGQRGLECVCNPMYIGDDCSAKCPGRDVVAEPCNGHGACVLDSANLPRCQCDTPWDTFDCGCVDEYTCNGHGTCNPLYDGTNNVCTCLSVDVDETAATEERRYGGPNCERCQEHWWGSRCHLFCDRHAFSQPSETVGKKAGCNGHGSCVMNRRGDEETIECECQSNYESKKQCSECKEMYFPKVFQFDADNVQRRLALPNTANHCSRPCSGENECHSKGKCNPDYDTTNHLCICDGNGKDGSLKTLDPDVGCSACQPNWYPKDLTNPNTRCTNYCADSGTLDTSEKIIRFGTDLELRNDRFAKDICTAVEGGYKVNPVCHVCSGNGQCNPDGGCNCNEGTTGTYCEIDCGNGNEACSGHGRCVRDELELWFFPDTNNFRCECLPYDPYTSEARLNLVKQGVSVEMPPAPNYYGKYCDYHCPTYNSQVCAGRGSCDTEIALNRQGSVLECTSDAQCRAEEGLSDAFCEVLSTPWDSIVPRFFSIGAESLGYQTCTSNSGTSCVDTVYSVDWGDYCVQMLNGWYPNQLNTVNCAFDNDYRLKVEDFFMNEYKEGHTFCEHALKELTPIETTECGRFSHPNKRKFENDNVVCQSFTLQSSCQKEAVCLYDQTIDYISQVDASCAARNALNCNGYCRLDSNQVCKTNTYCRAKNCADAISEKSLESMCLEYENVCPLLLKNLTKQCSMGLNNITTSSTASDLNVSSMTLFFVCSMFENSQSPTTVKESVPGDIDPNGLLTIMGRTVPVQEYRNAFVQSRSSTSSCSEVDFNAGSFCDKHRSSVLTDSNWYQKETPGWFLPWRLKCGPHTTLWPSETLARTQMTRLVQNASVQCTVNHAGEMAVTPKQWSLQCLEEEQLQLYAIGTRSFPLPHANAGCTLKENVMDARWGQTQWSPHEIESVYQETCLKAAESKVIPVVPRVPDFCATVNPCGMHECTVCAGLNCDYVECKHQTKLQPVCTDSDVTCGGEGRCLSIDTNKGTYKCKYDAMPQFNNAVAPIVQLHQRYREINWLKHCSDVTTVPMPLKRKTALNQKWAGGSEVTALGSGHYLFQKASIERKVAGTVQVNVDVDTSEKGALMSVRCNGEELSIIEAVGPMLLSVPIGTCTLEAFGKIVVTAVLVDNVETLSPELFEFEEELVTIYPLSLKDYIEFNEANTITLHKKNSYDISAADDSAGVQWVFAKVGKPVLTGVRVSGWLWLPSNKAEASMKLMSSEKKSIVEMTISTDGASTTLTLNNGGSCSLPVADKWNRWHMESKMVNETILKNDTTQHHIVWHVSLYLKDSSSGQECRVQNHVSHLSNSRLVQVPNRVASSFHTFTSESADDCHRHCLSHEQCLQWSWTEEDRHCYMYNKRCHEDHQCRHGTHTLHSSHSHPIHSFVFDTDSLVPITWGHLHRDQIVEEPPLTFYESYTDIINVTIPNYDYQAYVPDTSTVCNDLATTFHSMPGYTTHVCNGPACSNAYDERNMSMCAQFVENRYPSEVSECSALKELNWTAYCHYESSFHATYVDENRNYFPILGTTSSDENISTICQQSSQFKRTTEQVCSATTDKWFKQCLGRWQSYEDYCDEPCLRYIQDALSSDGAQNKSICEKRDEYLQFNISGNVEQDQHCSKKVEDLIITDFCQLQNTYHEKGQLVLPSLKPSCSPDCTAMLTDELNRTQWRNWCYQLSSGTITGTCSRTSCQCDTAENIGVAGELCELTCPSGTENGQEIACSGRNGHCFAADYNQISADTAEQTFQKEFRPENNQTLQQSIKDNYKPLWLAGPNPSATGICQCALGSGDSCSIPCDNCNNGTYGIAMASQYGICDAYYGLCRSLPPFMRLNVKKQTEVVMSFNSTQFDGMQWSNPGDFMYEEDRVLLDSAILDVYDYQGVSYGIESLNEGDMGFQQQQVIVDILDIFPRLCTPNGVWLEAPGFTWEGSTKYLSNENKIQNSGLSMVQGNVYEISSFVIESWGPCTRTDMNEEWFICFENGRLHAMTTGGQAMALFSMGQTDAVPLSGMSFAKVSGNTVYAFGGSSSYSSSSEALSNTLYKITLRKRRWENRFVVLAHWEVVSTSGSMPDKMQDAAIVYMYNELYLLSTVGTEPSVFVLALTLDGSAAEWTQSVPIPIQGNVTSMAPDKSRTKGNRVYLYIDGVVLLFEKDLGFIPANSPPPESTVQMLSPGFLSEAELKCIFEIKNNSNGYRLEFGQNTLVSHPKQPQQVFVYLEEWLNLNMKTSRNIYKQFMQSIEWRVTDETIASDVIQEIQLPKAIDMVEKIYMHQGRWEMAAMLFHTSEMYKSLSRNDMRLLNPSVGTRPTDSFLDIVKKNDASLLLNTASFVSALPANSDGQTVISVSVEGPQYSKDVILVGHRREFTQANIQYPYTEELLFQNGVIEIVVTTWTENAFVLELRRQGESRAEIKWVETEHIQTFHLVMHVEEWMYHSAENQDFTAADIVPGYSDWQALFNLFVSVHPEATARMKTQTNHFLQYYGSHCSATSDQQCPGMLTNTHMACSGHGRCNSVCNCECELAPSVLQNNANAYVEQSHWQNSPYRGDGCQITCPGFDGYDINTICSGNPVKCGRDGTCACDPGETGDACQFRCPSVKIDGKDVTCSGNGGCSTKSIEMNSTVFTRDVYQNRLSATHRNSYISALSKYYTPCQHLNYYPVKGVLLDVVPFKHPSGLFQTFVHFQQATLFCDSVNANYQPDLTDYETHLLPRHKCVGIKKLGSQYQPMEYQINQLYYQPSDTSNLVELFACTFSDCELTRHVDDKKTMSNVDFYLDPPKFEFHGLYKHGFSSGTMLLSVNAQKISLVVEWDLKHLKLELVEEYTRIRHPVLQVSGTYRRFVLLVDGQSVRVKLYKMMEYDTSDSESWLTPTYGEKYRIADAVQVGHSFNVVSDDTGTDTPILLMGEAEYACDIQEDCSGIIQWSVMTRGTFFSLYTLKNVVGSSILYPISEEVAKQNEFTFLHKMSFFYKGKNDAELTATCSVVKPRQASYPMVNYTTTYNVPVTDINFTSVVEPQTKAVEIGNGIWTNCWEKQAVGINIQDCYQTCRSKLWYGFAWSNVTKVCLCYRIDKNNVKLNKYTDSLHSTDSKTLHNPCDASNPNTPKTAWIDIQ